MTRDQMPAKRRLALFLLVAAALAGSVPAGPALAADAPISVTIDRAKVMRISRPADVVIIGNPAIADATIQDSQTLIITGRSYGTTNLIVLDSTGKALVEFSEVEARTQRIAAIETHTGAFGLKQAAA